MKTAEFKKYFECPVCGKQSESFLPFGIKQRPNAQCPVCRSLERHRLIWLYFKEKTNIFTDKMKILHIAPEGQIYKMLKALPNLEYISGDLMPGKAMVQMDITDIKYPDNAFDVIYASHVLEHIPDDRKAMRELHRVLKPSGWAILQVPISGDRTLEDPNIVTPEDRERAFGQGDHVRRYGFDGVYKARLEEAGFNVHVDSFVNTLSSEDVDRYGLINEDIYYVTKNTAAFSCASWFSKLIGSLKGHCSQISPKS
ncbi:MAG: methyltransferase domain-containing protein [Deltaproteobacteria bacterium]|nr:methyltransferase domain-containing protein [Deltaproteobacteria bacterium]MBZ0219970.1 methyltransferase domain-containing protein [Deltaproteobacteria bacterium]